ncbi:protein kinase domain-containing protein [Gordonia phthalatica]|nr:protein kinase [Gordonia phthalatica]
MGDVYVVENESLKRQEAMKVISVGGASNDDFQQRFTNEARTAASLDHPSIITVHSYGVADGMPWFTMSYVKGKDLASAPLTPADAVTVIEQVASGLDYAHARTVVHRDIKPANIVVTRTDDGGVDRAVMLDFGIAKLADSPQLTAVNSVVGTAAYTAPEIISGQAASAKSDQYSLACTAYQLFAGTAPFKADTTTALMMAHVQQPPPALGQARPDLAALGPVLQRAMSKDPNARYANCRAFAEDLRRALGQTQAGTATSVAGVATMPPTPSSGPSSVPGMMPPSNPGTPHYASQPGMTPPPQTGAPHFAGQPYSSQPGMTPPPQTAAPQYGSQQYTSAPGMTPPPGYQGQPSQPGMAVPPGVPPYPPGGGFQPAWGAQPAKKSKKGLWIALAAAAVLIVAIAGAAVALWPKGDDGPPPVAHPNMQLVTDSLTSCAVKDALLYCWGNNDAGQIGDGSTSQQNTPVKVPGLKDVTAVSIGAYKAKSDKYLATTCAVAEGDVYCWGSNYYSQTGDGAESERHVPAKVPGLPKMTAVSTDFGSTCAISEDEEVYCWGAGEFGQIGTGDTSTRVAKPVKVSSLSGIKSIDSGGGTVCAVNGSGELYCWGYNSRGQIGDGTTVQRNTPVKVQNLTDVTAVTIGTAYDSDEKLLINTCAIASGKVSCWGADSSLLPEQKLTPTVINGIENAQVISINVSTACAVSDGQVWCWGNNKFGQVGNNEESETTVQAPTRVTTLEGDIKWVTTGMSATCAGTDRNEEVHCWGSSQNGQIGNPGAASEKQLQPLKVSF